MQSFVINLDRSTDRLQFFIKQATAANLPFERISAIDGRKLSPAQLAQAVASDFEFQPINSGEIGLFLSHKLAWQRLVDSGQPHAAVFEDDVVLSPTIRDTFDAIDAQRPQFDLIKIETTLRRVVCARDNRELSKNDSLQTLLTWHGGTAGYVISAKCAKRLLQLKSKLSDQIDQVMFNPMSRISSQLRILQLNPAACIQADILHRGTSETFGTTLDRNITGGTLFRHGPLVDIRRTLKKQLESGRRYILASKPNNIQSVIPFVVTEVSTDNRRAA